MLGDGLVASDSNQASWGTAQDVKTALNYPKSGVGAVVTYVQIDVEQVNIGIAHLLIAYDEFKPTSMDIFM